MSACVDLRQFSKSPYLTEFERKCLLAALRFAVETLENARAVFEVQGQLVHIPLVDADWLIKEYLHLVGSQGRFTLHDSLELTPGIMACDPQPLQLRTAHMVFDTWFLPEPSCDVEILASLRSIIDSMELIAVVHENIPIVESGRFLPSYTTKWSPYFRLVSQLNQVICLSKVTKESLELLSGRSMVPGWIVAGDLALPQEV